VFTSTLVSTQPRIQLVPGSFSLPVKRPRRVADHSEYSAEVKNEWTYISIPPICFHGVRGHNFNCNLIKFKTVTVILCGFKLSTFLLAD
jgi:hypothetical protein